MQRNMFGLHAPVRMLMERELVKKVSRPDPGWAVVGTDLSSPQLDPSILEYPCAFNLNFLAPIQRSLGCIDG